MLLGRYSLLLAPDGYGECIRLSVLLAPGEWFSNASPDPQFAHLRTDQMRDFRDAKAMADTLRQALGARGVRLSHSESLELTAKALGEADWNTLSALIGRGSPAVELPESDTNHAAQWPEVARAFYDRHLTADDRRAQTQASPWTALFEEANALFARAEDARSEAVMDLARRWTELSVHRIGDNDQLRPKYAAAYKDALGDPAVAARLPISRDVLEFLRPAFALVRSAPPGGGPA
jgi:hypothetical protein